MGSREEYGRGVELTGQGDYRGAIDAFKAAVDQETDEQKKKDLWHNIAVCHLWLGEMDEADEAAALSGGSVPGYNDWREIYEDLHDAGVADEFKRAEDLYNQGQYAEAAELFEQVVYDENLDDDRRSLMYGKLAMSYLELQDWGRAEEFATVMHADFQQPYDQRRAALMQETGTEPQDLAHYDGSQFDDVFAHAKQRFEARDYQEALDELQKIVGPTVDRGAFGEEVWLYVALCHLYLGDTASAEGYASFLTGAWLDSYEEHKATVAPSG